MITTMECFVVVVVVVDGIGDAVVVVNAYKWYK
jgi:hypothetical protein